MADEASPSKQAPLVLLSDPSRPRRFSPARSLPSDIRSVLTVYTMFHRFVRSSDYLVADEASPSKQAPNVLLSDPSSRTRRVSPARSLPSDARFSIESCVLHRGACLSIRGMNITMNPSDMSPLLSLII